MEQKVKIKPEAIQKGFVGKSTAGVNEGNPILQYCLEHSTSFHPVQEKLYEKTKEHQRGGMAGAPEVIHLNMLLMKSIRAKKVIDVGVFTGVSTLAAAMSIPEDGKVIACDTNEEYANIGRPFWEEAGVAKKIDLRIKPALETLDELLKNGEAGTYDFAFIDADKDNYYNYFQRCMELLRPGGIISFDNVLWRGTVIDPNSTDERAGITRELNDKLKQDPRITLSMQNIGDGLSIALKNY